MKVLLVGIVDLVENGMQLDHRMQLTCSCSHNGFAIRDGFSESDKDFFTIRWGRHIDGRNWE